MAHTAKAFQQHAENFLIALKTRLFDAKVKNKNKKEFHSLLSFSRHKEMRIPFILLSCLVCLFHHVKKYLLSQLKGRFHRFLDEIVSFFGF
jgi:hypothetical protein